MKRVFFTVILALTLVLTFAGCGGSNATEEVGWDVVKQATCLEDGVEEREVNGIKESRTIQKLGHSYNDGVVTQKPSCTEGGEKTLTCVRCNETKTETINATGHSISQEYSCDADNHFNVCENCDEHFNTQGHNFELVDNKKLTLEEIMPASFWDIEILNGSSNGLTGYTALDYFPCSDVYNECVQNLLTFKCRDCNKEYEKKNCLTEIQRNGQDFCYTLQVKYNDKIKVTEIGREDSHKLQIEYNDNNENLTVMAYTQWGLSEIIEFEVKDNKVIKAVSTSKNASNIATTEYEYDSKGLVSKNKIERYNGEALSRRLELNYINGLMQNSIVELSSGSIYYDEYEYDEKDRLVSVKDKDKPNPSWTYTYGNNYMAQYIGLGNLYEETFYDDSQREAKIIQYSNSQIYSIVEYEYTTENGNEKIKEVTTYYTNNVAGNSNESIKIYNSSKQLIKDDKYNLEYNEYGALTAITHDTDSNDVSTATYTMYVCD